MKKRWSIPLMKWTIACYNVGLCCWFDTLCSCSCMPKGFLSAHECFNDHVDHSQWLQVLTVTHLIAKYIFYSSINCMYRKRLSHMLYYASMSFVFNVHSCIRGVFGCTLKNAFSFTLVLCTFTSHTALNARH